MNALTIPFSAQSECQPNTDDVGAGREGWMEGGERGRNIFVTFGPQFSSIVLSFTFESCF